MNKAKTEIREGTVILWTDKELRDDVEEALVQQGYTFDGAGLLKFIVDNLFDEGEDAEPVDKPGAELGALLAEQALNFLNQNPDAVAAAKRKVSELFSKIKKKPGP